MTSLSKNVYIDKLDNKVNKYNSTYHKILKSSLLVSRRAHILNLNTQNWSVFFVTKKR